jgi:hypothetical protein
MAQQKREESKKTEGTSKKISFPADLVQAYHKKKIKVEKRLILFSILTIFLVALFGIGANVFFPRISPAKVVKGTGVKQEQIVVGQPVKWTMLVKRSQIENGKYLAKLPKGASDIKVAAVSASQAQGILSAKPKEQLSLQQRQQLASFFQKEPAGVVGKSTKQPTIFDVESAPATNSPTSQDIILAPDATYVDLSGQVPAPVTPAPEVISTPEVIPTPEVTPVPESTSGPASALTTINITPLTVTVNVGATQQLTVVALDQNGASITAALTWSSDNPAVATVDDTGLITPIIPGTANITATSGTVTSAAPCVVTVEPSDYVAVQYTTPAPQAVAIPTDTGEQVTVSAISEDPAVPLVDILASAEIPHIFKVGQESKIHINWKNNGGQAMDFNAYDTDNDGYLDYVEWTVPHLSDQIFDIIFISKAFQLDSDQNITADIYDTVKAQDGNYATIPDGNYVRATFFHPLDSNNDITIYAKPTDASVPAAIKVYPVYDDGNGNITEGPLLANVPDNQNPDFSNINHDGKYRILLSNLQTPTDQFDLRVTGSVDVDYVVDPSDCTGVGGTLTEVGGYCIHTFTSVGTTSFVPPAGGVTADVLVVAGGGSGGSSWGGGGGGGGVLHPTSITVSGTTTVTVGVGGAQAGNRACGIKGANSVFGSYTAIGGGQGGCTQFFINSGGSGGGAGSGKNFGDGTAGQGYAGGNYAFLSPGAGGNGGGGGAGHAGYDGVASVNTNIVAGNGGEGFVSSISGTSHVYGSGGGGEGQANSGYAASTGGMGGTGAGQGTQSASTVPSITQHYTNASYYGCGGGGAWDYTTDGNGGTGYQGIVIVRYLAPVFATVPDAPTIGTATAGDTQATITFTPPASNGGAIIDYYTAFSSPSGINATTTSTSTITVTGLTNGTAYTFTIYAHNSVGTSTPSSASNSVTPAPPNIAPNIPTLVSPATASYVASNTPTLSAIYSDPDTGDLGTTNYRIATSAGNCTSGTTITSGSSATTSTNSATTTWTPGSSIGSDGTYYWCAQNQDSHSATSSWTSMGNFILDTVSPSLIVTTPADGGVFGSSVPFTASATDTHPGSLIPDLDSSLVSWWRMEGNVSDSIASNNGTGYGGISYSDGKFGKAMVFNGTDGYISYGDVAGRSGTLPYTISVWIKLAGTPSDAYSIIARENGSDNTREYLLYVDTDRSIHLQRYIQGGGSKLDVGTGIKSIGIWYHIVATYDGNNAVIYANGIPEGTGASSVSIPATNNLSVGSFIGGTNQFFFNGSIDDVMIYNRALTADEVTALYNGTAISHTSTLSAGSHTYKVYAEDLAGNLNSMLANTFTVDTTAPTTSITTPADNSSSNSSTVALSGASADTNLSTTTISVDGGSFVATGGTAASWTYSATGLSEGAHTFQTQATDLGGNTGTSSVVHVTVDATNPTVSVTSPNDGGVFGSSTPFAVSATDTNLGSLVPNLDNSLVGWWRGEEDATDYIGGNNGTAHGGVTYTTGKFGKSMTFDGVNGSYISTTNTTGITNTSNFTVSGWIKTSDSSGYSGILVAESSTDIGGFRLAKANSQIEFSLAGDDSSFYQVHAGPSIADGSWHFALGTYNGSTGLMSLYIDNILVGTTIAHPNTWTQSPPRLGAYRDHYSDSGSMNGSIDDTMIFNRALSADEVTALYNGTAISHASTLTDGSHTYKAYAEDLAGNVGTSTTNTFTVDTTNPTSTISTPADNTLTNSSIVALSGTSADTHLSTTTISVDGGDFVATAGSAGSWTYSATGLTDGAHTFVSKATDSVGNTGTSTIVHVTVDATNPTTSITSPADNTLTNSSIVALSGTSADTNLSTTTISVDGGSFVATGGTAASWTYSATGLTDGAHTFQTKATDLAGNIGTSTTVHVSVDSTSPTVSSVTVQDGLNVDVAYSEAMGTGVTTASNYTVSGSGKGTLASHPDSVANTSGNTYRLTWNSGEMLNGGAIIITVANAQDTAGNVVNGATCTATGGTITKVGDYCIHTFTNVGTSTFTVPSGSLNADVLVVAGGGQGGSSRGAGGGAGGLIYNSALSVTGTNTVIVGAGGTGHTYTANGVSGSNSVFSDLTAIGGGGGGGDGKSGLDGGSGGGGGTSGGNATLGQGNSGGQLTTAGPNYPAGGGGGAGSAGSNGSGTTGGNGGDGLQYSISGVATYYAGGGGGGTYVGGIAGNGGNGGGSAGGADTSVTSLPGTANTGGGGGGGGNHENIPATGGDGGSGIVIVRYIPVAPSGTAIGSAPTGYSASIDQSYINNSNKGDVSFTYTGAEVGSTYYYSISGTTGTPVTGSGTITTANQQITNIDLSGLGDGTITLSTNLTDSAGNTGTSATDTKQKAVSIPTTSDNYMSGFTYRKKITIDHTKVGSGTEDETNFPVLVSLTGLSNINTNGTDIRFTTSDGSTQLAREIESYSGGALTAWVKIPTLSHTVDTVIYMYYGNSSATEPAPTSAYGKNNVWDANYKGVWHLPNGSTLSTNDSTSDNGVYTNTGGTAVSGKINGAVNFDGATHYGTITTNTGLDTLESGDFTVSAWVYYNGAGASGKGYWTVVIKNDSGYGWVTPFQIMVLPSSNLYYRVGDAVSTDVEGDSGVSTNDGNWHQAILTRSGNAVNFYVDGVSKITSNVTGYVSSNNNITVGYWPAYSDYINAKVDELRFSNTARSSAWIATEYANQNSPSTFETADTAESVGVSSWQSANQTITLIPSAGGAGIAWTKYCLTLGCDPSTGTTLSSPYQVTISTEGTSYFRYATQDNAGNTQATVSHTFGIDTTAPTTLADATPYNFGDWTNANVSVSLICADSSGSGCLATYYCTDTADICTPGVDGTTFGTYSTPITISTSGTSYIRYFSTDAVSNSETIQAHSINIDKTGPSVGAGADQSENAQFTQVGTVTAGNSAIASILWSKVSGAGNITFGTPTTATTTISADADGTYVIKLTATDVAGNSHSANFNLVWDTASPVLTETTPVPTPATETAPSYTFNSTKAGDIIYVGSCTGQILTAVSGDNAITFDTFTAGTYSDCQIIVIDSLGNISLPLQVSAFTITAPVAPVVGGGGGYYSITPPTTTTTVNNTNVLNQIAQQLNNIAQQTALLFAGRPETPTISYPPLSQSVPQTPQLVFQNNWQVLPAIPSSNLSFVNNATPVNIQDLAVKFPQLANTFKALGMGNTINTKELSNTMLVLPTIADTLGSLLVKGNSAFQGVSLAELSANAKAVIPTNVVFARTPDEKIDYGMSLTVASNGAVQQTMKTLVNKVIELVVKPDNPVTSVDGYLVLVKTNAGPVANTLMGAGKQPQANPASVKSPQGVIVSQFQYAETTGAGIYTSQIETPSIDGQYKIVTVLNYKNASLGSKELDMTALIDPEGYVYVQSSLGETRIANVVISIYWLNPATNAFELWPAKNYSQFNPQKTDVTGKYSFLVPPGNYYMTATKTGYKPYKSDNLIVQTGSAVEQDIIITKTSFNLWNWIKGLFKQY